MREIITSSLAPDHPGEFDDKFHYMVKDGTDKLNELLGFHHPEKKTSIFKKTMKFPDLKNPYHVTKPMANEYQVHTNRSIAIMLIDQIARKHSLSIDNILSNEKNHKWISARYEAINLVKETYPKWSLSHIGRIFNNRDHSTIYAALKRVEQLKKNGNWPPELTKLNSGKTYLTNPNN